MFQRIKYYWMFFCKDFYSLLVPVQAQALYRDQHVGLLKPHVVS